MTALDVESLLGVISTESPGGDDLEYDPDFLAMQLAAEGKAERQMGDHLIPAEEPDWHRVREMGVRLLGRSKDLRVAVLLARAEMQRRGIPGLKEGLELIAGLISRFWDDLHPRLDPEDDYDPSARVNAVMDLCGLDTLLKPLRAITLIHAPIFGGIAYRDIEAIRSGSSTTQEAQPPDTARIAGAFHDCDLVELQTATHDSAEALRWAHALDQAMVDHLPPDRLPDLSPLISILYAIHAALESHFHVRQPSLGANPITEVSGQSIQTNSPVINTAPLAAQITSRQDVQRVLDRLCDYYDRYEPSSPVPLLLKRARRLVTCSFVDIVRDLAPDALSQIQQVCGIESED